MVRRKYSLFMVWPSGQSIGFVKESGFVNDMEVKLGKKEGLASLVMRKFLFSSEIGEVAMIRPNFERNRVPFKKVSVSFKGANDG